MIQKPLITEKSLQQASKNRFTFKVALRATKHKVRKRVEEIFKVKVLSIRTHRHLSTKIATVELKPGDKIDLFDIKKE